MNTRNLRILLAEGGHGEAAESLRALFPDDQKRLELTIVPTISTLLSTIRATNPEMILLDLALTRPEPLEAVRCVHRAAPEVPLIVFADAADKDRAAQCLREGALDYLLKGYMDPQTLDRVLRVALAQNTLEDLTDLLRDPLTVHPGRIPKAGRARDGDGEPQARRADFVMRTNRKSGSHAQGIREAGGRERIAFGGVSSEELFPADGCGGADWRIAVCGAGGRRDRTQRARAASAGGEAICRTTP